MKIIMKNLSENQPINNKMIAKESNLPDSSSVTEMFQKEHVKNEFKPVTKRLEELRTLAMNALQTKDLDTTDYSELINGIDKLTKNIQLLNGEDTERTQFSFTWGSPNAEYSNTIRTKKLGNETPQLQTKVEGLRAPQTGWEDSGYSESSAERRAFYSE